MKVDDLLMIGIGISLTFAGVTVFTPMFWLIIVMVAIKGNFK